MTLHAGWEKKVKDRRNRKNNNQDTMKRNLHCLNKENEKKIRGRIFSLFDWIEKQNWRKMKNIYGFTHDGTKRNEVKVHVSYR